MSYYPISDRYLSAYFIEKIR